MSAIPATIAAMRERLDSGSTTAVALVRACLARVDALDAALRAFLRLNPEALREAEAADRRRAAGPAGDLAGIPIAIKDNIATRGLESNAASRILDGFVPVRDATVVRRLREAGAVVLGKTNLDEFGMGSSTENSAFGETRNPWDPERVPGGSSGGSAVAVATGMAPVALGSDTGGSVRQPAAFCGVVGLKPTYGRVSRSGLIAFASSLEQVGVFGREVRDTAAVLQVIAGVDPADATSSPTPTGDYVGACARGVAGMRIGLPREFFDDGLDPAVETAVRDAAAALEACGARIEEVTLPHTRYTIPAYYLLATAEASSNLARYDAVRYGRRAGAGERLADLYRASRGRGLGLEVKRRIMLGTFALSAGYYDAYYLKAQRVRSLVRGDFLRLFASGLDLLLTPTTPTTAFRLGEKLENPLAMYLSDLYTTSVNLAGLPAMSVPLGTDGAGLPVGGQLIGPDFGEESVCRAGAVIERRLPEPGRDGPGAAAAP